MHTSYRYYSLILALVLGVALLPCSLMAEEQTYYDISASGVRKIMLAVPAFTGNSSQGKFVADLLSRGLELHGFIGVVPSSRYAGNREADWKSAGADYVVLGQVNEDANGLSVQGQILDVAANQLLTGRRFSGSVAQLEDMTLRLCDALIKDFTGEEGVSRTRIAFVSDGSGHKEIYLSDILGNHPKQITRHRALCVAPPLYP